MRKAVQIFYTLFLLTFVSQIYYGGTGSFLYSGGSKFNSWESLNNYSGINSGASNIDKITKASQHTNPRNIIRAKALNQNCFIDVVPFFIVKVSSFPHNLSCFSLYRSYIAIGISRTNLLRGPPDRIA